MANQLIPYEIPLSAQAQKFSITLKNITYNFLIVWNAVAGCWMLDITDASSVPILQGCPLVTGDNLLNQFHYLGFGGGLLAVTDSNSDAVPTFENLGITSHLYFFSVVPE